MPTASSISVPPSKSKRIVPSPEIPETATVYADPEPEIPEMVPVVPDVLRLKSVVVTLNASSLNVTEKLTAVAVVGGVPTTAIDNTSGGSASTTSKS